MSISDELFLAILAMDSYNRGYGAGITGLGDQVGAAIGTATVTKRIQDVSDTFALEAQAAGFYAIAYDWNGQTVIAFPVPVGPAALRAFCRGTWFDKLAMRAVSLAAASDFWNGWTAAGNS